MSYLIKSDVTFSILSLIVLIVLAGCRSTKSDSSNAFISTYRYSPFVAWSEDTIHNYQFAFSKGKKFYYTIIKKDSMGKVEEQYKGTVKLLKDTLFLTYYKRHHPKELTNFLIFEVSGNYLIQPFIDTNKRMFLRIQRSRLMF